MSSLHTIVEIKFGEKFAAIGVEKGEGGWGWR